MKALFLFLSGILLTINVYCQDIITTNNGNEIKAKVIEISPTTVKYKITDSTDLQVFFIEKSMVFMIKYQNGSKDIFRNDSSIHIEASVYPREDVKTNYVNMAEKGKNDADKFYHGYAASVAGTIATTVVGIGIYGLITASKCASTPPSDKNLNYPDRKLMMNQVYRAAYKKQAHQIKKRKIWTAFGTTVGIEAVVFVFISYMLTLSGGN